jgi:hypothetical protein
LISPGRRVRPKRGATAPTTRVQSASYIKLIFVWEYMPKISVEIPEELLADLDDHVGENGKFVNRSDAVRASIRKTLDILDDIDARHGRLDDE